MRFKFREQGPKEPKCSAHYIGDKVYLPGSIVESETDLAACFPQKFERIDGPAVTPVVSQPATTPMLPLVDFGDNVSANFSNTPDGYAVYFDKTIKYSIVDLTSQSVVRLGLRNETEVDECLNQLCAVLGNANLES